jgi:hypothetical protein
MPSTHYDCLIETTTVVWFLFRERSSSFMILDVRATHAKPSRNLTGCAAILAHIP